MKRINIFWTIISIWDNILHKIHDFLKIKHNLCEKIKIFVKNQGPTVQK